MAVQIKARPALVGNESPACLLARARAGYRRASERAKTGVACARQNAISRQGIAAGGEKIDDDDDDDDGGPARRVSRYPEHDGIRIGATRVRRRRDRNSRRGAEIPRSPSPADKGPRGSCAEAIPKSFSRVVKKTRLPPSLSSSCRAPSSALAGAKATSREPETRSLRNSSPGASSIRGSVDDYDKSGRVLRLRYTTGTAKGVRGRLDPPGGVIPAGRAERERK